MIDCVYSLNGELYYDLDTLMDEIHNDCDYEDLSDDELDMIEIYRGDRVPQTHMSFIDGFSILEGISQSAYNDFDEYAEDYCTTLENIPKDRVKELEVIISEFLNKEINEPNFFKVNNITKILLKDIV